MVYAGYGDSATVQLLIGGTDTAFFTTTNIDTAMELADIIVDMINSGASTANKGAACNLIAAEIMKAGRITNKLKGLLSDSGNEGRPARSGSLNKYVPLEAYILLKGKKKRPSWKTATPNIDGSW